jgi:hypothetical protein
MIDTGCFVKFSPDSNELQLAFQYGEKIGKEMIAV